MKKKPSVSRISFDALHTRFHCMPEQHANGDESANTGLVRIFKVEKGLEAKVWNCISDESLELYCDAGSNVENAYFTLAFFLNMEGLQFAKSHIQLQENIIWNTLFISSASSLQMYVPANTKLHSLTVSFSKKWLFENLLAQNEVHEKLREKIETSNELIILEYMSAAERQLITELVDEALNKSLPLFYIKAKVLKILSDFFNKIKEPKTLMDDRSTNTMLQALLAKTENFLNSHIAGKLPALKGLACEYGLSESTLRRHFKQKYGTSILAYFVTRKMDYAQQLICGNQMSLPSVAQLLGYKNVNHFKITYDKHYNSARTRVVPLIRKC